METQRFVLTVGDCDIRPLDDFPLRWRWTDERWARFSDEEQAAIQCLTEDKACSIDLYLKQEVEQQDVSTGATSGESTLCTTGDPGVVRDWLWQHWADEATVVIVSWDQTKAVAVPWTVFVTRWDDFCYPSSDDVTIAAPNGEWILLYAHFEEMRWLPPSLGPAA